MRADGKKGTTLYDHPGIPGGGRCRLGTLPAAFLGVRSLNFEAPVERKEELLPLCYRLHEVRVYERLL